MFNKSISRSHNPYFNRWFSAIEPEVEVKYFQWIVTILILIDGFLQYIQSLKICKSVTRHNPYFNR